MYEIFERLLAENGVKAYDVAKATGVNNPPYPNGKEALITESR